MTAIAVQPYVLKNAVLTVDVDDYAAHVSSVVFTPSSSVVTWIGLTPSSAFSDSATPTWVCDIAYAQDWTTADSFSQYLLENQGQTKTVVFKPIGATVGDPVFTADIIIVAGPIGGEVNTVQVGTVSCGVVGEPELSSAAA